MTKCIVWSVLGALCAVCPLRAADLKRLPGHVPGAVSKLSRKGSLSATSELRLAIGLQMRDPSGLERFVTDVSNPASRNFRHFLTREEVAERFGPTEEDYEAVKKFATANGLAIAATHANRLVLDVTGSAAAVQNALRITLRIYRHPGEDRDFFAPDTEPMLDAALRVADVEGLSDYWLPYPKRTRGTASGAIPKGGTSPDGLAQLFGNDFRNAYLPGTTLNGAGQIVGLVEFGGYLTNDIFKYASAAGNGRTNIVIEPELLDGFDGAAPTNADSATSEVEGDIEMVMAMAPGLSKIISYEEGISGNQNDILNAMLANSNVLTISCSWGWYGPSATTDAIFQSMDAVGQTFLDASGGSGAFTAGANSVNGVDNPNVANAPASNPYITQVGGTTLKMKGAGVSWASEVVWNWGVNAKGNYNSTGASSGGISTYYTIPDWQTNVPDMEGRGGSASFRNIPDVAANADNVYLICDGGNTNDADYNGGTSFAAPLWAGFIALVNQQSALNGGPSAGFINPTLYLIAAGPNYSACFHDVTRGSNSWSKSPGLFNAMTNYDLCTGLGTMNGTNLINALAAPIPIPSLLPAVRNDAGFTLSWTSVPGRTYQLQYASDLGADIWFNFSSSIMASSSITGASDSFTNAQRFYRVVLLPSVPLCVVS